MSSANTGSSESLVNPFKCVATLRRGHKPRFWRSTKSKKKQVFTAQLALVHWTLDRLQKGAQETLQNVKITGRRSMQAEEKRQKLIKDKHIRIQMENEKRKTAKWNERQENRIERRPRSHCAAASQSNKGNKRKWKAEREMGGGNAGIRGAMRRAGGFEREQVNVSQPLMMPEPF